MAEQWKDASGGASGATWPRQLIEGVLSHLPVIYFRVDGGGRLTELVGNGAGRPGIGEAGAEDWGLATHYPQLVADIQRSLNGKPVYFNSSGVHADQTWAFDVFLTPHAADGGAVGLAVDVTEGRRARDDLERFFDLSLDMLCIAGTDGFFKWVNPAFERVLGYKAEEMVAVPFLDFVHPEDRAATVGEIEHLAAGQPTVTFVNRYRHKDGGYRSMEWNAMPVAAERVIYAVARDVTALRKLDQDAQDLRQQISVTARMNSGVRLEEVLDSVYDSLHGMIPFSRVGVALIDDARKMVVTRWVRSEREIRLGEGVATPLEGSSLQVVAQTDQPRVINDLPAYLAAKPGSRSAKLLIDEGMRSSLTCPLAMDGRTIGFIFFSSVDAQAYDAGHVKFYRQVAGQLAVLVERGRLYSELAVKSETIERQHNAMLRDMELAQRLQRRLSPDLPPSLLGIETSHLYEPASQVGGDVLDIYRISDHQMLFLLGDAMGHGVRAALVMSLTKALFHTEARHHAEPEHVITQMNRSLCQMLDSEFVTAACALVDTATGTVDVVLAGHHPPVQFHVRSNTWAPIPQLLYCLPLGLAPDEVFINLRITMARGDMLLFYTDGLIEATNRDHTMYGSRRLVTKLSQQRLPSTESVLREVRDDVHRHCDNYPVDDDISMLAIKRV